METKRIEKEKKDIWKYCQLCGFSIYNGSDFEHREDGNFHTLCLNKNPKRLIKI